MFIGPFDKVVIDVIAGDRGHAVRRGDDNPAFAHAQRGLITVEPVIANNCRSGPAQNAEMLEHHNPVFPQFDIIGICIQRDGRAVCNIQRLLIRQKLAPINQHALTARSDRGNPPILWLGQKTIPQMKGQPLPGQQYAAGNAVALKIDITEYQVGQICIAREIQQIFEPPKGKDLRTRRVI